MPSINPETGLPQGTGLNMLKLEYRQVTGGNLLDKPRFWDTFKLAFTRGLNWLSGIAGNVLRFIPGLGTAGSAIAYGVQGLTQYSIDRTYEKRAMNAAADAQAGSVDVASLYTPGFNQTPSGAIPNQSIEVAPFARGYEGEISGVINNKGLAASESIRTGI